MCKVQVLVLYITLVYVENERVVCIVQILLGRVLYITLEYVEKERVVCIVQLPLGKVLYITLVYLEKKIAVQSPMGSRSTASKVTRRNTPPTMLWESAVQ